MASKLVVVCPSPLRICLEAFDRRRPHVHVETHGLHGLAFRCAEVAGVGPHLQRPLGVAQRRGQRNIGECDVNPHRTHLSLRVSYLYIYIIKEQTKSSEMVAVPAFELVCQHAKVNAGQTQPPIETESALLRGLQKEILALARCRKV